MHKSLYIYITNYSQTPLNKGEERLIQDAFVPKTLRKRQHFLRKGEVCNQYCFIVKGAMRQYSFELGRAEHVIQLGIENSWMGDVESFIMLTPSHYNIDAWESCSLLTITRDAADYILDNVPAMQKMVKIIEERNLIANQARLNSTISCSSDNRYEKFVNEHPDLLQRFPLHVIASYLGVTKETLSRIRKRITL